MDKSGANSFHEFISGKVGGVLGITIVYPLDTVKTRLQMRPDLYRNMRDVGSKMIRENGFTAMYRGISSPACFFGFNSAVAFNAYNSSCRAIASMNNKNVNQLSLTEMMAGGFCTGVAQSPVRQVTERLKSVMQMREQANGKSAYSWFGPCAVDLIRKEGFVNGLMQGSSATLIREIPQYIVYYPSYELSKRFYSNHINNETAVTMLAGGTAGALQWLPPIYCFDVIKTRMQTAEKGYYKGWLDCTRQLYSKEGLAVFFRGYHIALIRAAPLHAIVFFGYENCMKFCKYVSKSENPNIL